MAGSGFLKDMNDSLKRNRSYANWRQKKFKKRLQSLDVKDGSSKTEVSNLKTTRGKKWRIARELVILFVTITIAGVLYYLLTHIGYKGR